MKKRIISLFAAVLVTGTLAAEEPSAKPQEKEEKGSSECSHHFGYLANRPKDAPIPQECLTCPKIVDCMLKLSASREDESEK